MEKSTWIEPAPERKLTTREKLSFAKSILSIPICAPPIALRHFVAPPKDSPGPARAVVRKVLKTVTSIPVSQQIAFFPRRSTYATISRFCVKSDLQHKVISLPLDANLHFIGPEPETCSKPNILLYFHGRGYFDSVSSTQIAFALRCANTADATLVLLEYTLSNEAACPRQLEQANEALRYVLRLAPAENILLAGDSAGGHLIAGLLSWIMHPDLTPAEEESILLGPGEKLGGVCLISPMLSFDWGKPSYSINAKRDYLNVDTIFEMLEVLKPPEISFDEALNIPDLCPSDAPEQWWANMPVERLMITVGSWEVFFDSAAEFAEKVSRDSYEATKVELVVGWREWHAAPIVDPLFWLKEGTTSKAIMKWMSETGSPKISEDYDEEYYPAVPQSAG